MGFYFAHLAVDTHIVDVVPCFDTGLGGGVHLDTQLAHLRSQQPAASSQQSEVSIATVSIAMVSIATVSIATV